jgi:hypothetical protein
MGIVYGVWLLVLGCLAVPNLVIAKYANAKKILDKLAPFQGWIGLASAIWGLYEVVWMLSSLSLIKLGIGGFVHFVIIAVAVICQIALGFLLGIGIIRSFVKDGQAQAKLEQFFEKLLTYQIMLGILAIADGFAVVAVTLVPSLLG